MSEQKEAVPPGYWKDANGSLVPVSKIKEIDKLRHQCVTGLAEAAKKAQPQQATPRPNGATAATTPPIS